MFAVKKTVFLFVLLLTVLVSCSDQHHSSKNLEAIINCDLDSIRKRGQIIAVSEYNSTDYFIYKGEPMGFNYELLKAFSDNIGLDLEIIGENNQDKAFRMLQSGKADLIAFDHTVNSSLKQDVLFTVPIGDTRQVLVQRKPGNWRALSMPDLDNILIRSKRTIAGKTIYVQKGSSQAELLVSMAREMGDSINIIEVPFNPEKLIKHVASGEIDYTLCDESIAMVNSTYYPNVDVNTPVSLKQEVAWGIRKNNSAALQTELNRWISTYRKTESYALLYAKYFRNAHSTSIVRSDLYALNTGKVSQYDDMIRKFSTSINWDWRLLASLICQESRFNPKVESHTGAFGLMQIMPETGENFGIDITSSPENNLKAGIRYINWLHSIFDPKIPDEKERINFILAAYNAGPGHVLDAMKLAEKNGMDPRKWNGNVALWLLKKSQPRYFNDIVVKSGYFRGIESVNFVSQVLTRFEHYKNIIPEEKILP
jgi:membrane-bound lytic murein transglycosylase F